MRGSVSVESKIAKAAAKFGFGEMSINVQQLGERNESRTQIGISSCDNETTKLSSGRDNPAPSAFK